MPAIDLRPAMPLFATCSAIALLYISLIACALGHYVGVGAFLTVIFVILVATSWSAPIPTLFLSFTISVLGFMILSAPVTDWDSRSIWFFHAKRIWQEKNLYAYLDQYAPWSHNDYPPLLPSIAGSLAQSLGKWNEVFPRMAVLILLLPVLLAFISLLKSSSAYILWLSVLFVLFASSLNNGLINGYLDVMLGLYFATASILLVAFFLPEENATSGESASGRTWENKAGKITFLLLISVLPLIKNEGILGSLILLGLACFYARRKTTLMLALPFTLAPWLLIWKIPVTQFGIKGDLFPDGAFERLIVRITDAESIFQIMWNFVANIWLAVAAVFVAIAVWGGPRARKTWAVPLFCTVYSAGIMAVYFVTPNDLTWHLATSADRTFGAVNCVLICYAFFLFDVSGTKPKSLVKIKRLISPV